MIIYHTLIFISQSRVGSQTGMSMKNLQAEGVHGSDQVSGKMDIDGGSQGVGHAEVCFMSLLIILRKNSALS